MRNREKIFIITSTILFLLSWKFLTDFFEMAKVIEGSKEDANPIEFGFYVSIVIFLIYAAIFYFIWGMIKTFTEEREKK